MTSVYHCSSSESGMRIVLPNCSSGASRSADVVARATRSCRCRPSCRGTRRVSATCGSSPYASITSRPVEQVVELVGAAELDVGLDRDRVVGLHQRVEQLRDRDRLVRARSAWRSRRARGSARRSSSASAAGSRRSRACSSHSLLKRTSVRSGSMIVDAARSSAARCASISSGSMHRPLGLAPRRVADPRRVVADDQNADVPLVLEGAHAVQRDAVPEGTSGAVTSIPSFTRSGRPSFSFCSSAPSGRTCGALRVSSARPMPASLDSASCAFAPRTDPSRRPRRTRRRIRKLRLLALVLVLVLLGLASFMFGLVTAIASQLPQYDPAHQQKIEHDGYIYDRQRQRARGAARQGEPRHPQLGPDRADHEAGDRRDRGQALLRAPRRRPPRASAARSWRTSSTSRSSRAARRSRSSSSRTPTWPTTARSPAS